MKLFSVLYVQRIMRKLLLFASLLSGLFLRAQILNPSFENVTGNKPDNYNLGFYSTYFIRDTVVPHTGAKAAYIKGYSDTTYVVQGAVLGEFTLTSRPESLTGWYKCNVIPGDSIVFKAFMYKNPDFTGAVCTGYAFTNTSTPVYKQFTTTINYGNFPFGNVGATFISLYLSGTNLDFEGVTIPQTGTWAIIDDLAFIDPPPPTNTYVSVAENALNVNVEKAYPLPASDMVFLVYTLKETASCDLLLTDVTGKEVKAIFVGETQSPGRYKAELDLSNLPPGMYFTKLKAGKEVRVTKIIRQ